MNIFETFKKLLTKENSKSETPEGFCPQCWGRQEYGGKFFEAVYKEQITAKNIHAKKGWIQAYVEQNLEGIRIKKEEGVKECSACNLSYEAS